MVLSGHQLTASFLHIKDVHCSILLHASDVVKLDVDVLGALMKLRVSHQAYGALIVTVESSGTILLTTDVFKETPQLWNLFGGYAHGDIHSSSVFDKATHF